MATRRMHSADNLSAARLKKSSDNDALSPAFESNMGRPTPGAEGNGPQHRKHPDGDMVQTQDSRWIHRDKLAKIENEELQAAGIFVPRSRAPSKQRVTRERSQSRRTAEHSQNRSRKNSSVVDHRPAELAHTPSWDLRTPEEIAEEEAVAYFTSNGLKNGSRIPVAKTSPAPIAVDYHDRASRKLAESPEDENMLYSKPSSRSGSMSAGMEPTPAMGSNAAARRSVTDVSPKKGTTPAARKVSAPVKTPPGQASRPKTRSGSNSGNRPSTRSGEKPPEGDPPWLINSYRPDPRLPPDQQILPTVARRMQQEKWEKEGKFGDIYDRDFRPLNDKVLPQRPEGARSPDGEQDEEAKPQGEWPLKPEAARSPNLRQGSYSTMPKITDKPPLSPMSPLRPTTPQVTQPPPQQPAEAQTQAPERPEEMEVEEPKKGGCGCCIVM